MTKYNKFLAELTIKSGQAVHRRVELGGLLRD